VVVVTHDLNLAALYAHRMAVLHEGRIAAEGPAAGIMSSEFLGRIYRAGLWQTTSPAGAPIVGLVR
jgi:iron complex transport system ATP-binding protein